MGTARKPHNDNAGYICERRHPAGGHLVIYNAEQAGLCTHDGKYAVVLELPNGDGVIGPQFSSMPKAREFYKAEISNPIFDWTP